MNKITRAEAQQGLDAVKAGLRRRLNFIRCDCIVQRKDNGDLLVLSPCHGFVVRPGEKHFDDLLKLFPQMK